MKWLHRFWPWPAALACVIAVRAPASPPANYYLVWNDEFAGSSLDTTKWQYWLYPGTYKDATLSQSAVSEGGDHAVITTYTSGSTHYTAMLSTQGKFHARYGYFEANIQWADNTGMWLAFWLQSPAMGSYIGDPATGGAEIDTCEHRLQDGSANNINITSSPTSTGTVTVPPRRAPAAAITPTAPPISAADFTNTGCSGLHRATRFMWTTASRNTPRRPDFPRAPTS